LFISFTVSINVSKNKPRVSAGFSVFRPVRKERLGDLLASARLGGRDFLAVQLLVQGLADLEEGHGLGIDVDAVARAGIASLAGLALFRAEDTEAAQFDAVTASEGVADLFEDRGHDFVDITMQQMRIFLGDFLNQFGFCHVVILAHPEKRVNLRR
jgi:hypothetical protein